MQRFIIRQPQSKKRIKGNLMSNGNLSNRNHVFFIASIDHFDLVLNDKFRIKV